MKVKYHEIELDWRVELVLNALFYFEKCEEKKIICDFCYSIREGTVERKCNVILCFKGQGNNLLKTNPCFSGQIFPIKIKMLIVWKVLVACEKDPVATTTVAVMMIS